MSGRKTLLRKERNLSNFTGYDYEYCCAGYLKSHGFKKVSVTSASCDQGIDIVAKRRGHWYGIQCKYYSGAVGNKAVQEAFAGAKYHGCDRAMVITNSFFTDSAEALAESTGVELMQWMQPRPLRKTLKRAVPRRKRKKWPLILLILILLAAAYYLCLRYGIINPPGFLS